MTRVTIDDRLCVHSGVCIASAPHMFGDDGTRTVVLRDVEGLEDDARDAELRCPAGAVRVEVEHA